jgi:hypothetical protein
MKFIFALVAVSVAIASAEKNILYTEDFAEQDACDTAISDSYRTGSLALDGTDVELNEYTATTCDAQTGDACDSNGYRATCVDSIGSKSGWHKLTLYVPDEYDGAANDGAGEFSCSGSDDYSVSFITNECVNADEEVVFELNDKNITVNSKKFDCDAEQDLYYSKKDCSGDEEKNEDVVDRWNDNCKDKTCVGCWVATASHGSAEHASVASLRSVRDRFAGKTAVTRVAFEVYTAFGPAVASVIAESVVLQTVTRAVLTPLIALANMA